MFRKNGSLWNQKWPHFEEPFVDPLNLGMYMNLSCSHICVHAECMTFLNTHNTPIKAKNTDCNSYNLEN